MALKESKKRRNDDWEEKMEKEASSETAREKARGGGFENRLSIRDGRYALGGEFVDKDTKGKKFQGVVVNAVYLRTWYNKSFKEDNTAIPACWAIAEEADDLKPDPKLVTKVVAKRCEVCPKAEWGDRKSPPECGERRRLAVLHLDDIEDADAAAEATAVMLELPPTSVNNWKNFVKECKSEYSRPFYAVLVEFAFDDETRYPKVTFKIIEELERDIVEAIQERRDDVLEMLTQPYEGDSDDDDNDDEDDDDDSGDGKADKADRRRGSSSGKKKRSSRTRDEDDADDDDDDDEDEEDDGEDDGADGSSERSSRRQRNKRRTSRSRDDDEADDEDDDDEDEKPRRRRRKDDDDEDEPKRRRKADDDEDEEDEEEEKPKRRRSSKDEDDEDEDDEDEKPTRKKKRGSRFGR